MLIDATHAEETRVVVVDGNKVEEFDFETESKRQLSGNIYLAKVTRVEPSLQAAFVDYGGNRHGFLAFSEIHPDYYQIPKADRDALIEEERALAAEAEDGEETAPASKPKPKRRRRSQAARNRSKDAVQTSEVIETDEAPSEDAVISGDISGMETIDLTEGDAETLDIVDDSTAAPEAPQKEAEQSAPEPTQESQEDTSTADAREGEEAVETSDDTSEDTQDDVDADENADAADEASNDDADDEDAPSVEAVTEDEEDIRPVRKPRARRYKIQEVIKVRQIILVQVVKEERGNKGAALTTYLSLPGRYCVLMPNTARGGGISRKITNATDRKKLKEIANGLDVPTGAGLIIRTAGSQRTKAEIKRDYEYLQRLWEQIRNLTLQSHAPAKIYEEGDLIKRSIRDLYNREIDEVLVEGERGYRTAKDFMKMIMPSHAKNVKSYNDPLPLFARFQVESFLTGMFNPVVQLKSGGYLVIGVTEALVAIDVNSGRSTKEGSIEETALKTNLEAADEVARQLRLRDLAGLIVIDFIDMEDRRNNNAVEKRMKERLKTDRARIQVGRISGFGLMEMSRQRLRPGMMEVITQPCVHCHGTGLIRSDDSLALSILRQLEEEGVRGRHKELVVKCPVDICNYLINAKRDHIAQIETRYGISIRIEADVTLISPDFTIEKLKTPTRPIKQAPVVQLDTIVVEEPEEEVSEPEEASEDDEDKPKKRRRRRRRRKSNQSGDEANTADDNASDDQSGDDPSQTEPQEGDTAPQAEDDAAVEATEEDKPKKRRRAPRRKKAVETVEAAEVAEVDGSEVTSEPQVIEIETSSDASVAEDTEQAKEVAVSENTEQQSSDAPSAREAAPEVEPVLEEATAEPEPSPATAEFATEAPEAEVVKQPEPETPPKPKRRGWWSLKS